MFRSLQNIQDKKKITLVILILLLMAAFILSYTKKQANFGSAAKDPNACQIGGLMISLDENIWDVDRFQVVRYCESQGIFCSADSAVVELKYELEDPKTRGIPRLQFEYYQFDNYTYEQFIDDMEELTATQIDIYDSYTETTTQYEGYEALVYQYSIDDANSYYDVIIGKGTSAYGISYISNRDMYEKYLESFEESLNSIHINHF